jgi:hypothetical protein
MGAVGNAPLQKLRGVVLFGDIVFVSGSGAPTNGTTGTGAGRYGINSRYFDYTGNVEYVNVGTKAAPLWEASGAPGLTVSLTAAQIIAMEAGPVSVIAAPGAGLAVVVDSILFEMTTTSTAFTGGGAVSFVYHGGSVAVHAGSIPASVVTASAGTSDTLLGPAVAANGTTVPANTGVDITNATAPFAVGTGTAKVRIRYHVITL